MVVNKTRHYIVCYQVVRIILQVKRNVRSVSAPCGISEEFAEGRKVMSRITERSRSGALEAFLKGQKVLMLTEFDDDSLGIQSLEELLPEDARYLVDAVPAVENPEFKQAIEEMGEQKMEELTEESIAPQMSQRRLR